MVVTQQIVYGTITSTTGSGTQNDPVIIQGNNTTYPSGQGPYSGQASSYSFAQIRLVVESGTTGTLYVKIQADQANFILVSKDNVLDNTIPNPSGQQELTFANDRTVTLAVLGIGEAAIDFNIEYYYVEEETSTPTLNWMTQRPTYSNNALVFYKSGTANGAVGSVVNSRVISRRT